MSISIEIIKGEPTIEHQKRDEFILVLDENGVSTGELERRETVHKKGKWHRVGLACIINKKREILLQKRSASIEKYPDYYDISVATHIRHDDISAMNAINRAINQELGIPFNDTNLKNFQYVTSFRKEYEENNIIEKQHHDLFLVKVKNTILIENIKYNTKEVQNVIWANISTILEMERKNLFFPRTEWISMISSLINKI
jgi:isopentenyldiphosphate isomerase